MNSADGSDGLLPESDEEDADYVPEIDDGSTADRSRTKSKAASHKHELILESDSADDDVACGSSDRDVSQIQIEERTHQQQPKRKRLNEDSAYAGDRIKDSADLSCMHSQVAQEKRTMEPPRVISDWSSKNVENTKSLTVTANMDDALANLNRPISSSRHRKMTTRNLQKEDSAFKGWLGAGSSGNRGSSSYSGSRLYQSGCPLDKNLRSWLNGGERKSQSSSAALNTADVTSSSSDHHVPSSELECPNVVKSNGVTIDDHPPKQSPLSTKPGPGKGNGLEDVLSSLRSSTGPGLLDQSRENWSKYKEDDMVVAEELDAHKKDKNRYTDKVAFLKRAELREWEADMKRKHSR